MSTNKITVGLFDSNSIKNAFDDVLMEYVSKKKYQLNHSSTDLKILLGLICIGLGTFAQFYPRPFPNESYYPVLTLVSIYLVVYSIYYVLFVIIEKNILLKIKKGGIDYEISTQFDKGTYTVTLTSNKKKISEISLPHHEYITSKGEVLSSQLRTSFNDLFKNIKSKSN